MDGGLRLEAQGSGVEELALWPNFSAEGYIKLPIFDCRLPIWKLVRKGTIKAWGVRRWVLGVRREGKW